MASKKDGSAGSIIAPVAPAEAIDALDEKPGGVTKASLSGQAPPKIKVAKIAAPDFKPPTADEAKSKEVKLTWIEIELLDKSGAPVAGAPYEIKMKDGTVARGTLNEKGMARVEDVEEGTCEVTFPEYAPSSWAKK
jgi:hypothetical protein